VAVALDSADAKEIINWAAQTAPLAKAMKIGLQAYLRFGANIVENVREVAPDAEIFLDLKLHDIPATVRGAAQSLAQLRPDFLTVHASGGVEMIKAAAEALPETRITAVTVLTSLDSQALTDLGLAQGVDDIGDVVTAWSKLAVGAGARAIVCSPNEVAMVRGAVGPGITLITPGVRPSGDDTNDQARVSTPRAAQDGGADLLVIGRPITGSANPAKAIAEIVATLD
jgi:orotidine-5'-phosphate decarboxylase